MGIIITQDSMNALIHDAPLDLREWRPSRDDLRTLLFFCRVMPGVTQFMIGQHGTAHEDLAAPDYPIGLSVVLIATIEYGDGEREMVHEAGAWPLPLWEMADTFYHMLELAVASGEFEWTPLEFELDGIQERHAGPAMVFMRDHVVRSVIPQNPTLN